MPRSRASLFSHLAPLDDTLQQTLSASLVARIADLLSEPVNTDLTLLADSTYNLHQCIVCPQSAVLAKLCQPAMQLRSLSSSSTPPPLINDPADLLRTPSPPVVHTAVVHLRHHDVVAVNCMAQFFYRMSYDPYQSSPPSSQTIPPERPTSALAIHVRVFKLANELFVEDLKSVALSKLTAELQGSIRALPCNVPDFIDAAEQAYEDIIDQFIPLRAAIVKGYHKNKDHLRPNKDIQALLDEIGPLGREISEYLYNHGIY